LQYSCLPSVVAGTAEAWTALLLPVAPMIVEDPVDIAGAKTARGRKRGA